MPKTQFYTPRRFAELTDRSIQTVWRWIRDGEIDAKNIGSDDRPRYKIPVGELDKLTEDSEDNGKKTVRIGRPAYPKKRPNDED